MKTLILNTLFEDRFNVNGKYRVGKIVSISEEATTNEAAQTTQILEYLNKFKDESKGSKFRKTGYSYPQILDAYDFGPATETLILELNTFSTSEPIINKKIETYVSQFLSKNNFELIKEYELESFDLRVLGITRTFVEKLLSILRIALADDSEFNQLKAKIRHFYDIHKLYETDEIKRFCNSEEFPSMIEQVLNDDLQNPEYNKTWENKNINDSPLLNETLNIFKKLTAAYNNEFRTLLFNNDNTQFKSVEESFNEI